MRDQNTSIDVHLLRILPLTASDFAPFGDVVGLPARGGRTINDGTAIRYDDIAALDLSRQSGRPLASLFDVAPWPKPISIVMLERHRLSSQTFIPMHAQPFLVVVAPAGDAPTPDAVRAFVTDCRQGVSYAPGTWHHPVIALDAPALFTVIGRWSAEEDCDIHHFEPALVLARD